VTFQKDMGWTKSWSGPTAFRPCSPCRRTVEQLRDGTWERRSSKKYIIAAVACAWSFGPPVPGDSTAMMLSKERHGSTEDKYAACRCQKKTGFPPT
jgi:hypothetical protein